MGDLHHRLAELRSEAQAGAQQLELLDARRVELRDTLLRIGGAIQVLEELLAADNGSGDPAEALGDVKA